MTAADILRERARQTENVSSAAFAPTSPDLLRAVADLMERVVDDEPGAFRCRVCGSTARSEIYSRVRAHIGDCPLAALERLIEGEPAKIEGERDGA